MTVVQRTLAPVSYMMSGTDFVCKLRKEKKFTSVNSRAEVEGKTFI